MTDNTIPNPAGEVGASLEQHLAAQEPQEWPTELLRNDAPAYIDPSAYMGQRYRWTAVSGNPVLTVVQIRGTGALAEVRLQASEAAEDGNWFPLADFRRMVNSGEMEPMLEGEADETHQEAQAAKTLAEEMLPELCEEPGKDPVIDAPLPAIIEAQDEPKGKRTRKAKEPEQAPQAPAMTLDDLARCIELKRAEIEQAKDEIERMQAKAMEMVGPLLARIGLDAGRVSA